MKNIQKYIVLLLIAMLFMPDSAWAQANKQEFVIKGVVEDSFGPVAGASIIAKNQPGVGTITIKLLKYLCCRLKTETT